jgi:hypothetical protein
LIESGHRRLDLNRVAQLADALETNHLLLPDGSTGRKACPLPGDLW